MLGGAGRLVRRTLWDPVPRDHWQQPRELRRRQIVSGVVLVVGVVVLAVSLRITPGSDWFYPATFALALVWTVGAFASGPLHLGRGWRGDQPGPRPILVPLGYGVALAALFVVGALVVRRLPYVGDQVRHVLDHAHHGSVPLLIAVTAVNGVAEELFFRGALYAATTRRPVAVTTAAYVVATVATGNLMLAFAAVLLGTLDGLQRRATGGIQAPMITHVTWSLLMLLALPLLF